MIMVRQKWQMFLFVLVMQMVILNFVGLAITLPKSLSILSTFIGLIAFILVLAPYLSIYEYKEDKDKKKQLQKFCTGLENLKNQKATCEQ